jgi:methionyl-tRNA formyltransferase
MLQPPKMPQPLKVIFMGTPAFAVPALMALMEAGHHICAVYSQPPRPAGRGYQRQLSPVHAKAMTLGIPVYTPLHFKEREDQHQFQAFQADVAVVVAYGLLLRQPLLEAPRFGCLNIHASLLPRWRGAAPIQHALMAGDTETGITIMQMDEGLDTGPILLSEKVAITPTTTASLLHEQLSVLGARLIVETLNLLQQNQLTPLPQPAEGATYAHKLHRAEGLLDWQAPAAILERKVRALNPWPGTYFTVKGENIKVLQAEIVAYDGPAQPGTVIDNQLTIACGQQALRPLRLQRPGKTVLATAEFLKGTRILPGTCLIPES